MKTKEELYAEDVIKTFIPKDKNGKIVKYEVIYSTDKKLPDIFFV